MHKRPARVKPHKRRILIVNAHALVRRGLAALIDSEPDLLVCGQATTQRAGMDAIASASPDLVIADFSFEEGVSLALVQEIRLSHPHLPVLLLSIHDAPIYAARAFNAGASGYVTKQELNQTLLIAIRRVLDGKHYLSPKIKAGRARG